MRRAGPIISIGFEGTDPPGELLDLARAGEVGGVTLFARNIRDAPQVRDLLRALHEARPLPVCIDQEGGNVVRVGFGTVFPSAMAFGATRDAALVERAAGVVARELRALGIGVLLAPVCDVNAESANPVIGTRSFSDDPALCAELAAVWVRGAQAEGVACTAKHFPGHGASSVDSHLDVVTVDADRETLERRELAPFRAAVEAGVAQIMSAHVRFPALDADRPATYSPAILRGLLRSRLRFDGVVCSDALEMEGARRAAAAHPAVLAIAAGCDIAHLSLPDGYAEAIDAVECAMSDGTITAERCADAIRRARAFAARYARRPADEAAPPSHELAREVARRALTHVGPLLPDLRGRRITVAAFAPARPGQAEELRDPLAHLERALRERLGSRLSGFRRVPGPVDAPDDEVLAILTSSACFDPAQAAEAKRLARHPRAVVCALRSPYDARLFPDRPAVLTYSDVPASCDAVADLLAGALRPAGTAPVRLA